MWRLLNKLECLSSNTAKTVNVFICTLLINGSENKGERIYLLFICEKINPHPMTTLVQKL